MMETIVAISELFLRNGVFIDIVRIGNSYIPRIYWYNRAAEVYTAHAQNSIMGAIHMAESIVQDELREKAN